MHNFHQQIMARKILYKEFSFLPNYLLLMVVPPTPLLTLSTKEFFAMPVQLSILHLHLHEELNLYFALMLLPFQYHCPSLLLLYRSARAFLSFFPPSYLLYQYQLCNQLRGCWKYLNSKVCIAACLSFYHRDPTQQYPKHKQEKDYWV